MLIGIAAIAIPRVLAARRPSLGTFALETSAVRGIVDRVGAAPIPSVGTVRAASLFDIDSELAEYLDDRQRAEARSRAIVPVVDLPAGPWSPDTLDGGLRPYALMVTDGLVLRELLLIGSTASEMLGPGDIVAFGPSNDAILPASAEWSVPQAARVAILDDRLAPILRTWPGVGRLLLDRAARREVQLSTHRAIAQLPRVDQRLLAFFAYLAERWGRVGASGVVIPIHLTHETLGRLIGARRPTVSLALKDLAADGVLHRREDGAWLLGYDALARLGAESVTPMGWQPADARPLTDPEPDADPLPRAPAAVLTADDVASLRDRVRRLHSQHAGRVLRTAGILERSRETRGTRAGHRSF
jgi:CRP-like cAMP-binding protein